MSSLTKLMRKIKIVNTMINKSKWHRMGQQKTSDKNKKKGKSIKILIHSDFF